MLLPVLPTFCLVLFYDRNNRNRGEKIKNSKTLQRKNNGQIARQRNETQLRGAMTPTDAQAAAGAVSSSTKRRDPRRDAMRLAGTSALRSSLH